ncbi:MAG: TIGR02996 domain-containing protein [Verrucomicrobiales bacterium]
MSEPAEKGRFLAALQKNEDDIPTRLAFADWLDETGAHEEAARQRRWPQAKQWIKDLCDQHLPTEVDRQMYDEEFFNYLMGNYIPYERLMEMAHDAASDVATDGDLYLVLGGSESLCCDLRENAQLFWENWSIISGIPIDASLTEDAHFSCAC